MKTIKGILFLGILCSLPPTYGCSNLSEYSLLEDVKRIDWGSVCYDTTCVGEQGYHHVSVTLLRVAECSNPEVLCALKTGLEKRYDNTYPPATVNEQVEYFLARDSELPYNLKDICTLAMKSPSIYAVKVMKWEKDKDGLAKGIFLSQYEVLYVKSILGEKPSKELLIFPSPRVGSGLYVPYPLIEPGQEVYLINTDTTVPILCPKFWPYSAMVDLGVRLQKTDYK